METKPKRKRKGRKVIAINGWGEEFEFISGREAARELGIPQSCVNYVLTGQRKSSGGYRFKYDE